jgi:probable phosphoglycerate mutase
MKLVVYLARHGETDWNAQGRMQGQTDVPLNDVGRDQARDLADQLRGKKLGAVGASDLLRASETASIVAETLGLRLVCKEVGLRERAFGVFEGLTRDEIAEKYPDHWKAWRSDAKTTPPKAETHEALVARMTDAVGKATKKYAKPGKPLLLVTHGGGLKAFLLSTLDAPALVAIPNGAVYRFEFDGKTFKRAPD